MRKKILKAAISICVYAACVIPAIKWTIVHLRAIPDCSELYLDQHWSLESLRICNEDADTYVGQVRVIAILCIVLSIFLAMGINGTITHFTSKRRKHGTRRRKRTLSGHEKNHQADRV